MCEVIQMMVSTPKACSIYAYFLFRLFLPFPIIFVSVTLEDSQFFEQIGGMGDSILLYIDDYPPYSELESMTENFDETVTRVEMVSRNDTNGKNINKLSIFVSKFSKINLKKYTFSSTL